MNDTKKIEIIKKIYEKLEEEVNDPNSETVNMVLLEIVHHALYEHNEPNFDPEECKTIKDFLERPAHGSNAKTVKDEILDNAHVSLSITVTEVTDRLNLSNEEEEEIYGKALYMFYQKYKESPTERLIAEIEKLPFKEVLKKFRKKAEEMQEIMTAYYNQATDSFLLHQFVIDSMQKRKINKFNMSNIDILKEIIQEVIKRFPIFTITYYVSNELFETVADSEVRKEILAYVRSLSN